MTTETVINLILAILSSISVPLILKVNELIRMKIKDTFYQKVSLIIWECVIAIAPKFFDKIADGKFDEGEQAIFKKEVISIVTPRLMELRGFAKEKLGLWLSTQVDVLLGKFLLTIGAGEETSDPMDPDQDPLASAVATEQIGSKQESSED